MPARGAVFCALVLSGCYLSHPPRNDPPRIDAGRGSDQDAYVPSPPVVDAALPSNCLLHVADFACTDTQSGFIPVGVPYELPIYVGDGETCYCGEQIGCTATRSGRTIDLSTSFCVPAILCGGCMPYIETRCMLPPLEGGDFHVRVNGRDAFDLRASNDRPVEWVVDSCRTTAADPGACGLVWEPRAEIVDVACFEAHVQPGAPIPVAIEDYCFDCGDVWASCTAVVHVTRGFSSIHITPMATRSGCDIECDECIETSTTCMIPPLGDGEYQVTVEGMPGMTRLLVGGGFPRPGRACLSSVVEADD